MAGALCAGTWRREAHDEPAPPDERGGVTAGHRPGPRSSETLAAGRVTRAALLAPFDLTDSWLDRVLAHDRLRVVVIENGRRQYPFGGTTDTWTPAYRMALYVFGIESPLPACSPSSASGGTYQRSPSAVGDQVECFEHQLADQDLASGRSHDGLGPRGEVSDLDRHVGHGPFFAPFVRVDDGSRSPVLEPQLRCDFLGDDETHRPGVDHPFHRRSSDVCLRAQPKSDGSAVVPVLQGHAGSNLSHRHGPLGRCCLQLAGWIRTCSWCHATSPLSISSTRRSLLRALAMTARQGLFVRRCISAAWLCARPASWRSPV